MGTRTGSVGRAFAVVAAVCGLASSLLVGQASAEPPDFLLQAPETQIAPGEGAGELDNPRSVAVDPGDGHIFIADRRNFRVSEYSAWGLFVKSWGWGVADGSAEPQVCGPAEPSEDPDPALCQKGIPGEGKGQMELLAGGIAVDAAGNVWVGDLENLRVQKFSPAGQFIVMFGGDVNKIKVEEGAPAAERNRCPVAPTDVCQAGTSGEGPSQLSNTLGDHIDYTPSGGGGIAVGDTGGIQIFNLDGTHRETIPFTGALAAFAGLSVNALDVDKDGNVFFSLSGSEDVFKISPAGAPLAPGKPGESKFEVGDPLGVAVDVEGNVYAIDDPPGALPHLEARVLQFDAAGNKVLPTAGEEDAEEFFPYVPFLGPALTGLATNLCAGSEAPGNLLVAFFRFGEASYVNGYGTSPVGCEAPPVRPPVISAQYGISAGTDEAIVKAQINPFFWSDTTYYVEYGTGKCSEGGCPAQAPVPPAPLTDKSVNAPVATAGVVLDDLLPGTTYHYRFVAESGGGGPVFGIDPDGKEGPAQASFEEGLEATFRTFAEPQLPDDCTNDSVRIGAAANLPDCRAYEMVSPLDKGNADVGLVSSPVAYFDERNQSATSGEKFTYSSMTAFDDPEGAPSVSQYLAERGPLGWGGDPIAPPRTSPPISVEKGGLANEFHAFSPDLCSAWLRHNSTAALTPEAVTGFANLYRRENCAEPRFFEALTTVEPPSRSPAEYFPLLVQGFASDVTHAIFTTDDKLHPDAPTLAHKELLLYEHVEGETRFVCYLPGGEPIVESCSAGTAAGHSGGTDSSLRNAISADGSRIFWTAYSGEITSKLNHPGSIYVRIDGQETVAVSGSVASEPAFFWTAADDGSKAIFRVLGGAAKGLYEFDVDSETPTLIASGSPTPLGASEDASRVYFVSGEDLDAGGPASAGALNLYLYETNGGGTSTIEFVMALGGGDVGGQDDRHAAASELPAVRSARVSPDGRYAVFTSSASPTPTGYDNRDATSGQPVAEVYRYDAETGELLCVSCNPTGIRPTGVDLGGASQSFWVAARIQGWEFALHAPRVLSHDGSRVFFESHEALVPRDTNGAWDVYQWEQPGKGTCEEGDANFHEANGGCMDLISSGESPADSKFLDADPSGDNVFIATQSSLIGADYGLNDVYVARVGGGFPEPGEQVECEGEACPTPRPPPPEVTPPSATVKPDNDVAKRSRRPCPKGKRRVKRAGKTKCVKRKARRQPPNRRRGGRR